MRYLPLLSLTVGILLSFSLTANTAFAEAAGSLPIAAQAISARVSIQTNTAQYTPLSVTASVYQRLPIAQQENIAKIWHLNTTDYGRYLNLMENSPSAVYYQSEHLDPSWILGFNTKDDTERKKFALIAIRNERTRITQELAFQQVFYQLQRSLYPDQKPIATHSGKP